MDTLSNLTTQDLKACLYLAEVNYSGLALPEDQIALLNRISEIEAEIARRGEVV